MTKCQIKKHPIVGDKLRSPTGYCDKSEKKFLTLKKFLFLGVLYACFLCWNLKIL